MKEENTTVVKSNKLNSRDSLCVIFITANLNFLYIPIGRILNINTSYVFAAINIFLFLLIELIVPQCQDKERIKSRTFYCYYALIVFSILPFFERIFLREPIYYDSLYKVLAIFLLYRVFAKIRKNQLSHILFWVSILTFIVQINALFLFYSNVELYMTLCNSSNKNTTLDMLVSGGRFLGTVSEANFISYLLIFSQFFINKYCSDHNIKYLPLCLFVFTIWGCIASGSRASVFGLPFLFPHLTNSKKEKIILISALIVVLCLLLGGFISDLSTSFGEKSLINRLFFEEKTSSLSSEYRKETIFESLLLVVKEPFLFDGIFYDFSGLLPHSTPVFILLTFKLFSFPILFILYIIALFEAKENRNIPLYMMGFFYSIFLSNVIYYMLYPTILFVSNVNFEKKDAE